MPMQAFRAALNILLFRAGPQDFPYSEDPTLGRACIALGVLASALFFGLSMPPLAALAAGAVAVAGVAMFTRVLLRVRRLENRHAQTLHSLLTVGAILLLVMRLPASELMPAMRAYLELVQQNPDLANQPDGMPKFDAAPALLVDFLSLWFVAVSGHVFRHAANLGFLGGALVALLCLFNVMMLLVFMAPVIALFAA